MSQFMYVEKNSVFHRLHPSAKIVGLAVSFLFPLAFTDPRYLLALWLIAIPAGVLSGGFRILRKMLGFYLIIIIAGFFLWMIFTRGGSQMVSVFGIKLSREAILFSAGMSLRLGLLLLFGMIFIASTRIEDFHFGLTRLGIPFPISFALSLSFRLAPIFSESAAAILQAQRSRGLKTSGSLVQRFRSYFPLFVPVFISALRRVDHLSIALETRGFGAGIKRTSWVEYRLSAGDYLFLAALIFIGGVCLYLRVKGLGAISLAL